MSTLVYQLITSSFFSPLPFLVLLCFFSCITLNCFLKLLIICCFVLFLFFLFPDPNRIVSSSPVVWLYQEPPPTTSQKNERENEIENETKNQTTKEWFEESDSDTSVYSIYDDIDVNIDPTDSNNSNNINTNIVTASRTDPGPSKISIAFPLFLSAILSV